MKTTKKLLCLVIAVLMIMSSVLLVACGGNGTSSFVVKFETNGGSKVKDIVVAEGDELVMPEPPTKKGFKFSQWYSDEGLNEPWELGENGEGLSDIVAFEGTKFLGTTLTLYAGYAVDVDAADIFSYGEYGLEGDYVSLWDWCQEEGITVDVSEVTLKDNLAYATIDGEERELGMDFLSMAMVYGTDSAESLSSQEEHDLWWKYYALRWNYLLPQVPTYSNEYYDVYSKDVSALETTPFWAPIDEMTTATTSAEDGIIAIGNSTELSGAFISPAWGRNSGGASDIDVNSLINGYSTVSAGKDGAYAWDMDVLVSHNETTDEDGNKTFTMEIKDGLVFSDESAITAKNYVVGILAGSTELSVQAKATGTSGQKLIGYEAYNAASKKADSATTEFFFEGVKLPEGPDGHKIELTISAAYLPYFYDFIDAGLSPAPEALYLGEGNKVIVNDEKEAGISKGFFANTVKDEVVTFTNASDLLERMQGDGVDAVVSGPFQVKEWDSTNRTVTLMPNPEFEGDTNGVRELPTVNVIVTLVESETQLAMLESGEVDALAGITGGTDTKAALALVTAGTHKESHYARAGFGNVSFRGDFGPTYFTEVRQAIGFTIDTDAFAKAFTQGYGTVVYGPYGLTTPEYVANEKEIKELFETYAPNTSEAKAVLVEGGWTFNGEGKEFVEGTDTIRYKKLSGADLTAENLAFRSKDGAYNTVKIDGEYYMPLVINWFSSTGNEISEMLISYWQEKAPDIGMEVQNRVGDFTPLLGELYQEPSYGWNGQSVYNAFNLATGFTSSLYDYSYNWSIDPQWWGYSACYIKDAADYVILGE